MSVEGSRKVVLAALAGNLAIAACKFGAALVSGSTATLAEAVHSVADSGNQALLLVGIALAARPADERYPFGRASELYFWPFVVALILFSVGGAFAIYEGVHQMLSHGGEALRVIDRTVFGVHLRFSSNVVNYVVLGTSCFFEAMSFRVAFREFKHTAGGKPVLRAFFDARDPTVPLVLAEDTTALIGLSLALAAVVLRGITGAAFWDSLGSILIGVLLCAVAAMLAYVTHGLLIGKSASDEDHARVRAIVEKTDGVDRVTQMLSVHLGPEVVVLALKIAFTPGTTVEAVEELTNEMERRIRKEMPRMRKIFIEVDAHGDGRGLKPAASS
ncbi:MAG TPA: cation diffusion facilitator family transporter [Polyangiaceae bacterium]|nr:cation diffusion facilitator family transporter [Polyangiaceae bacterium]